MLSELERSHIIYHAGAGENINTSIEKAKELAARESFRQNKHIKCIFVFNDVIMEVSQYSDLQERASFFTKELDRHSKEHRQSDEYKRYEEERRIAFMNDQELVDSLMNEFDRISNGPYFSTGMLIDWFMKFAPIADRTGLKYDTYKIVNYLREHGYKPNAYLNMHQKAYEDHTVMVGYIFGQILDMFDKVGCIHPGWMSKMGKEFLKRNQLIVKELYNG